MLPYGATERNRTWYLRRYTSLLFRVTFFSRLPTYTHSAIPLHAVSFFHYGLLSPLTRRGAVNSSSKNKKKTRNNPQFGHDVMMKRLHGKTEDKYVLDLFA